MLEEKRFRNYGTDAARSDQADQGRNEVDEKNDQIAHRRIVAGQRTLRNHRQNNNSPAGAFGVNNLAQSKLTEARTQLEAGFDEKLAAELNPARLQRRPDEET